MTTGNNVRNIVIFVMNKQSVHKILYSRENDVAYYVNGHIIVNNKTLQIIWY